LNGVVPNEHDPAFEYFTSIKDSFLKNVAAWEKA
jgi:hypothetical protein